jgi:hypothetical protein
MGTGSPAQKVAHCWLHCRLLGRGGAASISAKATTANCVVRLHTFSWSAHEGKIKQVRASF